MNITMIASILGGIGLFLLGMTLMTDGLKTMAGDALKNLLSRFTGGTFSSIFTGASITALIQSSSATTLMTIGFVSAGLLSFVQSIGVIIGANVGSTSTGWIVSLIGFKVNMSVIALPLIGIGVFLKLFSKGRFTAQGLALAGFGLIFVGIDVLQDGMGDVAAVFDLAAFAGDTIFHVLLFVFIGMIMTIIMQSSSAAVVTTLAALASGAIDFQQAVALVIGQNVGTTFTAIMASIGGTTVAKRTALAHTLFNVFTAFIALVSLPFLISLVNVIVEFFAVTSEATAIAIFHTLFNVIGVFMIAPFIKPFARSIEKVYPEKGNLLTKHLDSSVTVVPSIAMEAARRTLLLTTNKTMALANHILRDNGKNNDNEMTQLTDALTKTREFLKQVNKDNKQGSTPKEYEQHIALIHVLDHVGRLHAILQEKNHLSTITQNDELKEIAKVLTNNNFNLNEENTLTEMSALFKQQSEEIAATRREYRPEIIKTTVISHLDIEEGINKVQALHWLDRLAFHLWRASYHLELAHGKVSTNESEKEQGSTKAYES